jgi:hypothetical protein
MFQDQRVLCSTGNEVFVVCTGTAVQTGRNDVGLYGLTWRTSRGYGSLDQLWTNYVSSVLTWVDISVVTLIPVKGRLHLGLDADASYAGPASPVDATQHPVVQVVDKVDYRSMGGSFRALPEFYRRRALHVGCNGLVS